MMRLYHRETEISILGKGRLPYQEDHGPMSRHADLGFQE